MLGEGVLAETTSEDSDSALSVAAERAMDVMERSSFPPRLVRLGQSPC